MSNQIGYYVKKNILKQISNLRLNERIVSNNECYQRELDNHKNKTIYLDNEMNKLKKEIQEMNKFSSISSEDLKIKEERFKLLQYEYEENIIEV